MKMKKLLALLLVVVMVVGLVACGGPNNTTTGKEPDDTSDAKDSQNTTDAKDLEYVELNWQVMLTGSCNDLDLIQAALDEYFLEKLNCKVTLVNNDDYMDNMGTKLLAGEEMDLVHILTLDYAGLSRQGAFYPLDDLWEYGPNVKAMYSDDVWKCMNVDGKIYAAPGLRDNAYLMGVTYNNTLATALGYDMDEITKDWNSMMDVGEFALEAVKLRNEKFPEYANEPLMTNFKSAMPYAFAFEALCGNYAGCNVPENAIDDSKDLDTVFNMYETEAYKDFVLLQNKLVQAGVYVAGDYSGHYDKSTMFNAGWGYSWIDSNLWGCDDEIKLKVFEDMLWTDAAAYTISCTAIPVGSKNPERAMMVLDLLMTDPYLATICRFGAEGEHWEKDADGKVQVIDRNSDPANMGWLSWYGIWHPNLVITECPESYSGPNNIMLEKMEEYVTDSVVAKHTGFVFNTEPVANEVAACNNVVAEYDMLNSGEYADEAATLAALDEFNAKLKANGLDKIIAEMQAQIDAYVAAN